jgi:hypothetical protein
MARISVTKEMLNNLLRLHPDSKELSFEKALTLARKEAAKAGDEPMLLAWYDRSKNRWSPNLE